MRCIIIDDEPLAISLLESYVNKTDFLSLAGTFSNAISAREYLDSNNVDLVFLDIQMPGMNGLQLAQTLDESARIIFTTAFGEYAIEGFKVEALDYLLKPISYEEFLLSALRAKKWYEANKLESLFVKDGSKRVRLNLDDIIYIQGEKDYLRIVLTDNQKPLMVLMNMKDLEQVLPSSRFLRVHRSFIVNITKAVLYEKGFITIADSTIPVSVSYRDKVLEYIGSHTL